RRIPERLSSLVLMTVPAALIALVSLPVLYPWTDPLVLMNPIVAGKRSWLNIPFFSVRVVICLALWILAYRIFVGGSIRQDSTADPGYNLRMRRFAPLFMVLFGITLTVVAFDWISSLDPVWYSDIFGVYLFAGTFLAGLAATTLAVLYLRMRGRLPEIRPDHLYNLGGFLFAFIVFWSYIGFAQYLLMWYANLPEEVLWYRIRLSGAWGGVVLAMALLHFLVPFFILMARGAKSDPRFLAGASALVLFSHLLDLYWMVFPSLGEGVFIGWQELSFGLLAVSAALLWIRKAFRRGEDMPVGDPMLRDGLEFRL
ncbi:MAG: quinol:cytochrome C oxidoreductase, partial [Acidobacteria bacterium]|nr:quinol:cytochrome C oxidoreductase [Acidobacteriota bacterium]